LKAMRLGRLLRVNTTAGKYSARDAFFAY
jgi:hypothetical protein